MPNTLAHLGIQSLVTRSIFHLADIKWVFLGAILPDIPWIIKRIALLIFSGIDPITLRLYAIAQASLLFCLILAAALSLFSQSPRNVCAILSLNAFLHLLLDALQTKWGNGVHLLAPVSWNTLNFGLFWPESWLSYALTLFGLVYIFFIWQRKVWGKRASLEIPKSRRCVVFSIFLLGVFDKCKKVVFRGLRSSLSS